MKGDNSAVGRNDPCPCGSGQKFKRCCGQVGATSIETAVNSAAIGAAVALLERGQVIDAENQARRLLAQQPESGLAWKILSVALMQQGRDAVASCRQAAARLPRDAEAQRNLGVELSERRQWAEAMDYLGRAAKLDARNADYLAELADAMREVGDVAGAVDVYQRALRLDGQHVEAQNNLGNALMELHRPADAIDSYTRALHLRPNEVQIMCNLSNAQRQSGRVEVALASADRALAVDPRAASARNHRGLALLALGRHADAIDDFTKALTLNPRDVAALINQAQALRELGRQREAVDLCRKALESDPASADAHCNLGNAQFDLRLVDDAGRAYREAIRLNPRHVAALTGLALVLRQQRRHEDAETTCRAALAADPARVEALSLLGELRADAGQFAEAETLFNRALTRNPRFAFAYSNIAAHRRMTLADQEWKGGVEALLAGLLPVDQRVSLHFALGKFFDDTKQYDEAFAQFRQGNELTRTLGPAYDATRMTARVDRIIAECDEVFARDCAAGASDADLPVFIVGMPRSGTSLVEQILASHPGVFGAGEVSFWDAAFDAGHSPGGAGGLDPAKLAQLGQAYLRRVTAMAPGALRIVDKMPANFLYAGLIHAVFPRARVIHMRRHPVDTCLSIYFQNFFSLGQYTNDLDALVHYYRQYVRVTDRWRTTLPATALLEVPYEALTADQEGWSRRLVEFVGLPWDPRCLEFHETERSVITASKWQVRQKMSAGSAGRWRHYEKHLGALRALLPADVPGEAPAALP